MCRPATCRHCGKTTWAGCGMHVDRVLARVPAAERCDCATSGAGAPTPPARRGRGLFRR